MLTALVALIAAVVGALVALVLRAWRRPTPSLAREVAEQKLEEERTAAETEHAAEVEAIEERHETESARDPVDVANDRIRRRLGRTLPVLLLLASMPARADEPCVAMGSTVVCEREGFAALVAELLDAEKARDVARADATRAQRELAACTAVVVAPEPPRAAWPLVVAGSLGVAVGVVVGVVITK